MQKVSFPYRSKGHLQLLHVVAESGAWERQGLEVEYDRMISADEAHDRVLSGDVDFVGGNHISPYGLRARGDRWVYLGQTVNVVPGRKLVVRADSGINGIADLREKVVGSRGSHPQLNDWLQLKQHGLDVDRDEVKIVGQYGGAAFKAGSGEPVRPGSREIKESETDEVGVRERAPQLWQWVLDGSVDAAFLPVPEPLFAERAGLRIIDVPTFPMIYFTTISTSLHFLEQHPDLVERFLKGLIDGIHFFKTQPERSAEIIRRRYQKAGDLDETMARAAQATLAAALEPKLYPSMEAIANVYAEGIRRDKDAAKINPMALWDLHMLRRIDDSGFADDLYRAPSIAGT